MKRKLVTIVTVLLIAMMVTSSALAGNAIKLSNVDWKLGSLISKGFASGLGNTDWVLVLDGVGHAGVICTNHGSNDVPGQSFPHVVGRGITTLPGSDPLRKNGKSPYYVAAQSEYESVQYIPWDEGGCPNPNWTARIDFVFWDFAVINVYSPLDTNFATPVATYQYRCETTYTGPNSTPTTFDDGRVSCTQIYPTK